MPGIPRIHLFEIEDQVWCPRLLRDLATDHLRFLQVQFRLYAPMRPLLAEVLAQGQTNQVVDLCSGGGGPVLPLVRELGRGTPVHFTLTDLFPNQCAFRTLADAGAGSIRFEKKPIDARAVPRRLVGVRTFFNCFHHFRPADARAIVVDAVRGNQPMAVFELSERRVSSILCKMLVMPVLVLLTAPLMRPVGWARLLWTYVIPLVPVICWWDGLVSQFRAYTREELIAMAKSVAPEKYHWRVGRRAYPRMPGAMTFLVGAPASPGR